MAYARPNKTQPGLRPPARRGKAARVTAQPTNPLADFIESAGTTNFGLRVWMAWDPPTSTFPNWVDITPWVEQDKPVSISPHGRTDGLADVNASRLSLTVDNSDGRFTASNPSGPWFGSIHKGNWIKVEIVPPSGTVSQRFVGFVTNLPTAWQGQYAISQITASDRFEKLGQAPALVSAIQSEVLTDPNLAGKVKAYWNLHEPAGSLTFGDTSGNSGPHLTAVGVGGATGLGFGASNVAGPGFDNLRAVTFNPPSTSQGTYLTAAITSPVGSWNLGTPAYTGLYPTVEFWFQATSAGTQQPLVCLVDPVSQSSVTIFLTSSGQLEYSVQPTAVGATSGAELGTISSGSANFADGNWHHVVFAGTFLTSGGNYYTSTGRAADGGLSYFDAFSSTSSVVPFTFGGTYGSAYTQIIVGGGFTFSGTVLFQLGAANISDVAFYWGDMGSGRPFPNIVDHYNAGRTGNAGESTDKRVARVARYAGVPIPLTTVSAPIWNNINGGYNWTNQVYNPSKSAWTNLSAGAHTCGPQSVSGRKALDVMREAARTEGMPLYVDRSGYLALQPSTTRQNTTAAWTVDARDLDPNTALADDFAYTVNQMTVTPNSQAAQTVIGATGQASQSKYGVYDKSQATASLNPVEARSLGLSYIQLGADPAPRLAPLVVEAATLATQTGYGASWYDAVLATEISTPIRVTNPPAQTGLSFYDVLVEGWTETITAGNHVFSFTTSPIQGPTYVADDVVLGHADTDGSTLAVSVNTSATTLSVTTTSNSGASWTTNAADFPFDIRVDAEQMTVTAIGSTVLGVDGTFESGVASWFANVSTLVQSNAAAHSGTFSGLCTATGINSGVGFSTPGASKFAVNGGATYLFTHWMKLASGTPTNEEGYINWYTSGGAFISSSTTPVVTPTGSWFNQVVTATAPANATQALAGILFASAAAGDAVYIDDFYLIPQLGGTQPFTVTRSVNGVVASHNVGAAVSLWQPLTLAY